jgi:hypothetical protein
MKSNWTAFGACHSSKAAESSGSNVADILALLAVRISYTDPLLETMFRTERHAINLSWSQP